MNRAPWYLPFLLILPAFYPLAYESLHVPQNQIATGMLLEKRFTAVLALLLLWRDTVHQNAVRSALEL